MLYAYMGVDQNYGPFWGLYYGIFLIGDQKGPIILINPHMDLSVGETGLIGLEAIAPKPYKP